MATVTRYVNTGSTPGGDGTTNNTSGATRAYASLNEAEASLQRTTTDIIDIICDGSTADTTSTTFDGWTVTSPGYILVRGASSHGGKWDTSKYRLVTSGNGILVREQPVQISDLQIAVDTNSTTQYSCIEFDSNLDSDTRGYVQRCVLRSIAATTGKRYGVYIDSNNGKYYIANNVMYDFIGASNSSGIRNVLELTEAYAYHNTFCGCNSGWYASNGVTLCRLSNNLFQDNTHSMINSSGTSFHSSSNYNVCDDNETGSNLVPGANSVKSTEITFTDETNDDFRTSDANAQVANNLYSDANLPVTVDIVGTTRPSSGSVYAGAYEYVSSGTDASHSASTLTLTGALNDPTVIAEQHASFSATTLALSGTLNAPTVTAEVNSSYLPASISLVSSIETPTVSAEGNQAYSATTLALTGTLNAPTVTAEQHASFSASTLALSGTLNPATLTISSDATVTPSHLSLPSALSTPTILLVSSSVTITPDTLTLIASHGPIMTFQPKPLLFRPYGVRTVEDANRRMGELSALIAEIERRLKALGG